MSDSSSEPAINDSEQPSPLQGAEQEGPQRTWPEIADKVGFVHGRIVPKGNVRMNPLDQRLNREKEADRGMEL